MSIEPKLSYSDWRHFLMTSCAIIGDVWYQVVDNNDHNLTPGYRTEVTRYDYITFGSKRWRMTMSADGEVSDNDSYESRCAIELAPFTSPSGKTVGDLNIEAIRGGYGPLSIL